MHSYLTEGLTEDPPTPLVPARTELLAELRAEARSLIGHQRALPETLPRPFSAPFPLQLLLPRPRAEWALGAFLEGSRVRTAETGRNSGFRQSARTPLLSHLPSDEVTSSLVFYRILKLTCIQMGFFFLQFNK